MLEIKNICKTIDGKKIVDNVSIKIKKGKIIGLLGPNGSGKSTSFYIMLGFIKQDSGNIILDGNDISSLPTHERAKCGMIYLSQEGSIFQDLTVEDNIMMALEMVECEKATREKTLEQLIDEFNISHIRKSKGISLSGGERRRVEIARCLGSKPSYILLDEPFAGVDPVAISDIKALIMRLKNKNIGVLITDHNVKDALTLIDRGYIIYQGKILTEGYVEDIINNESVKEIYLGKNFAI